MNLFCQEKPVRISGRVIDSESGRPLPGASVIVEGTRKGTVTDVEGQFFLTVNATGKFSIRFGNIGYTSKLVSELGGTETLPLDISLERNKNNQMEAVVVTSPTARKQSISGLYLAQKNSSSISDGIPAEIIRRSPDRNTGEVLKRVSGASIQDNKFVVIRGLSERYNVSIMNNSVLPSTEPDKKAFSFDIIPSSVIDNLVIFKSPTPDLPGRLQCRRFSGYRRRRCPGCSHPPGHRIGEVGSIRSPAGGEGDCDIRRSWPGESPLGADAPDRSLQDLPDCGRRGFSAEDAVAVHRPELRDVSRIGLTF